MYVFALDVVNSPVISQWSDRRHRQFSREARDAIQTMFLCLSRLQADDDALAKLGVDEDAISTRERTPVLPLEIHLYMGTFVTRGDF